MHYIRKNKIIIKIFLFIFSISLTTPIPIYSNYYTDLFKKLVPSWRYGAAWLVTGFCLWKGWQNINNNWFYNQVPQPGDVREAHSRNKWTSVLTIKQNEKDYQMNYDYRDYSERIKNGFVTRRNYSLYINKLIGSYKIETYIIPECHIPQEKEAQFKICKGQPSWPSKRDFRQGLGWGAMGAASLLGTIYALSKR